jgi:hypothetical protein
VLAFSPVLLVAIGFPALQRTANFSLPTRHAKSFSPCSRGKKSTTKNIIDIVVFRGADTICSWLFTTPETRALNCRQLLLPPCRSPPAGLSRAALGRNRMTRSRLNINTPGE